jgi:excisionase family DNA binding protein
MDESRATLTIPEAGTILGISRAHAYDLAREGVIPSIKLGRRTVVPRHALEVFMASASEPKAS